MAFVRKTWLDRISEEPQRRILTPTDGSTPLEVDVTRNEGVVTQEGDAFSAANMNDLEGRIEAGMGAGDVLIAGTETSSTSTNAYAIGQYLIYNNLLYRVTAAIAVGNSLVAGVNIVQARIADELSNHLVVNGNAFYFDIHDGEFGYNTSPLRGADTFVPFKRSRSGSFTINDTNPVTINIGKRPTHVCIYMIANASGHYDVVLYDVNYSSTKWANVSAGVGTFVGQTTLNTAMNYHTFNITDTGFTVSVYYGTTLSGTYYYIAD